MRSPVCRSRRRRSREMNVCAWFPSRLILLLMRSRRGLKAGDGFGFVREGYEDGEELGDLEHVVDLAARMEDLDLPAQTGRGGVAARQFAEAAAIDVADALQA